MKQSKKFTKEWIEFTLCNMVDEAINSVQHSESSTKIMKIIKKYSAEIYNSQDCDNS